MRERAELEIASLVASLPAAEGTQALQRVLDGLKERNRHGDTYALLGRLRSRGLSLHFPRLGIGTRLRLAKSLRNSVYPKRGIVFHFRTLKGMSAGIALASIILPLYLCWVLDLPLSGDAVGGMIGICVVFWVIAIPIVVIATPFTSPVRYHPDILGAGLLDVLMAALASAGFAGLCTLAWLADQNGKVFQPEAPAVILCAPVLAAAGVRVGTLAAFGIFRRKLPAFLSQVAMGGLCAVAIYSLAMIASGQTDDPFVSLGWLCTLIMGFGLAGAYARIDSEVSPRSVLPSGTRLAAGALASLALLVGLIVAIPLPEPQIEAGRIGQFPRKFTLRNVPATIHYQAGSPLGVTVDDTMYTVVLKSPLEPENFMGTRIERNRNIKSAELWDLIPQLTKLMSWPQIWARITQTEPVGGPVLVTVLISRPQMKPDPGK